MKPTFIFLFSFFLLFACVENKPQIPLNKSPKDNLKENLLEMNKMFAEKENQEIESYIKENKLETQKSPLAFWYKIQEKGEGRPIKKGTKVRILFNLRLLDGTICYTPQNKGKKEIVVGKIESTKGLDESLLLLNEGGSGLFIIPSALAFGIAGDQDCVGAKQPIIYEILHVEIIPQSKNY
jgi:FKBP-type peptidyl-prolyl cis-trans isomerase